MRKYLYIFLFLPVILILGAGCISSSKIITTEPDILQPDPHYTLIATTTPINETTSLQSICSEYDSSNKSKIFSQAFHTTLSEVFSEPDADFTFEYPSYWGYTENRCGRVEDPNSRTWNFRYQNENVLTVAVHPYETAFDGCLGASDVGVTTASGEAYPSDYFSKFNIYSTNDPKTTILVQICDNSAHITFENGYHPQTVEEYLKNANTHQINPKKFHMIVLDFYNTNSKPSQKFLDWVERIGKSIKIKQ